MHVGRRTNSKAHTLSPLAALLAAAVLWTPSSTSGQVLISEVMASNADSLRDADKESSDWVELLNTGPQTLDLEGWGLSDDPDDPFQWTFPHLYLNPDDPFVVFASGKDRKLFANDWETVIERGDLFRWIPGLSEPPLDWYLPDFDDSSWSLGSSGFGFGDNDDATVVQAHTVYIRTAFELTQESLDELEAVSLNLDFDDGFVAFINGVEVGRSGLAEAGEHPPFDARAEQDLEARIYRFLPALGSLLEEPHDFLVAGTNVLAVQVHNFSIESDDLSMTPILSLGTVQREVIHTPSPFVSIPPIGLHTNFKLKAAGETLYLTRPDGSVEDQLETGFMYVDHSVGRLPDDPSSGRYYFTEPTPRLANTTEGRPGYAAAPGLASPSGTYEAPFTVTLTQRDGYADAFYTLDGAEPSQDDSTLYTSPFTVTDRVSTVRVRSFKPGLWPSPIRSATYLLDASQSPLPILSLVVEPDHLFDNDTGIYVFGDDYSPEWPFFGANFWEDWERPLHVDFFEPDGSLGFSVESGVKIHGGWSRANEQRSLRLVLRNGYGDGAIDYQVFPELAVQSFERLILRNAGQDWTRVLFRDALLHRLGEELGFETQAYRPAVTFINGEYWGLHNLRERQDATYLESRTGWKDVDILNHSGGAEAGEARHYNELLSFMRDADMALDENYDYVRTQLEVDNYQEYLALQVYFSNADWPDNNLRQWRPRTEDGRWRFMLWDLDMATGYRHAPDFDLFPTLLSPDTYMPEWATELVRLLLESPTFELEFVNRYLDLMNTSFSPENMTAIKNSLAEGIEADMPQHLGRWGHSFEEWSNEVDTLDDWFRDRPPFARSQLADTFGLGGEYQLSIRISPPGSGSVRLAAITVEEDFSGLYLQGAPVTLEAIGNPGFVFDEWSLQSIHQQAKITVDPNGDLALIATFRPGGNEAQPVINEINYNSSSQFDPEDWVEILNPSSGIIDLSGWTLRDESDANELTFPDGTLLGPSEFVVVAKEPETMEALFPGLDVLEEMPFGLSGGGDSVRLFNPAGELVDTVTYDDQPPWPTAPDGGGPSLELLGPTLDNSKAESWVASSEPHGSPGQPNGSL